MSKKLEIKITKALSHAKKHGMRFNELLAACAIPKREQYLLRESLRKMEKAGEVIDCGNKIYHTDFVEFEPAVVTRLNKTFGFVKLADGSDMFIPGKFFLGALPNDSVLVMPIESRGGRDLREGQIIKIVKEGGSLFSGCLGFDNAISPTGYYIDADDAMRFPVPVRKEGLNGAKVGDKVLCHVIKRGESHSEHKIVIQATYGSSDNAAASADAILDVHGIKSDFPIEVSAQADELAKRGISAKETANRLDLRDEMIFTIDGADTKDIDDAISIKRLNDFYELSVHIADVSYYVKHNSPIDREAFERGTSIYFADRVIPMLPKALSNGICSLNPDEDRLAFSCIMTISSKGELIDFDFKKTVIRSRIKGVYSEINAILQGTADDEINAKYKKALPSLKIMEELADILTKNRLSRGAPEIETAESKIILDENSSVVDVVLRTRGQSEMMIEEFMLMANEAAATAARLKEIPFVYRVHEPPSEEKTERLHQVLEALGINAIDVKIGMKARVLARLLRDNRTLKSFPVINSIVLRSMSKAKYYQEPMGHYGLALENYAQFTSPIRRYPDLVIHRILSDVAANIPLPKVRKQYEKQAVAAAKRSTETELNAVRLERMCDDCYKAEYMKKHIGEEYDGIISGLAPHGIYVELPNTIEGLVRTENMPQGDYVFDELIEYKETISGKAYRIGDSIKVKCVSAVVSSGKIDFAVVE